MSTGPSRESVDASPGASARAADAVVTAAIVLGEAWTFACVVLLLVLGHSEYLEFALYLLAFAVALPAAIFGAWWLLRRERSRSVDLRAIGALGAVTFGAAVLTGRVVEGSGSTAAWLSPRGGVLLALGTAVALQVVVLRSGSLSPEWRERFGASLPIACFAGAMLALAAFLPSGMTDAGSLLLAVLITSQLALAYGVRRSVRLDGWRGHAFAIVVVLAIVLIATDVDSTPFPPNDNLYLGPVNDILHGRSMLVDAYSQYGVGNMYILALVFKVVPFGYGTFELFNEALWLILLGVIYAILRVAGAPRFLCVLAIALIMLSSVFTEIATFGFYLGSPSVGPLRFGLAFAVVLAMVLGARRERPSVAYAFAIATVALSAVWSFETFVYSATTFLAACGMDALSRDDGKRRFLRFVAAAAAACLAAHAGFAIATKVRAGSWPDWPGYLEFIREYGTKGFGQLPVEAWSVGLPMGFFYFCSAVALVSFAIWRRDDLREHRESFVALAALTALSIVAYTYFLGRSHVNNLHHIAPPAIALAAVWLGFLSAWPASNARDLRPFLFALAFAASSLVIVDSVPDFLTTWHRTVLYRAAPIIGHGSALDAFSSQWDNPAIESGALEAGRLLAAELPGQRQTVVLVDQHLTVEVLVRAGRLNALPMSAPLEDNIVPGSRRRVLAAIKHLPAGTGVLVQVDASGAIEVAALNPLQRTALRALQARFTLKRLRTQVPFAAMQLVPKRPA